jgi:DNA polymerase III epsilon subunit-like protein
VKWLSPLWRSGGNVDGTSLDALIEEGFVALDIETTGLDPRRDRVVEVAAIPFVGGQPRPGYVSRVDPGGPVPPDSIRIHGLRDEDLLGAPALGDVLERLEPVCSGRVLTGHGVAFDLAVLDRERKTLGLRALTNIALDTRRLAIALHPDWPDHGLDAVAARAGIGILGRHTAEGDALAAGGLLLTFVEEARMRGVRTLAELRWLQESSKL